MKARKQIKGLGATLCYTLLSSAILTASAQAEVAQIPLNLSEGVPPNMIFTLDDSTSMHRAYVPDSGYPGISSRRFRAADANPMAYDPNVTYHIPPAFNKNGSVKTLSTSFDKAWYNGFNPRGNSEFLNLRDGYIVASQVAIGTSSTSTTGVNNPSDDFKCTLSLKNGSTGTCSGSGKYKFKNAQLKIKRTGNSSCQAFFELDTGATINVSGCSQTSGSGDRNATIDRSNSSNRSVPAYYYVRDEGCLDDDDKCYSAVIVSSTSGQLRDGDTNAGLDERQNFANWFSFYRSRSLATVAAASLAFYNLDPSIRFTWQALVRCSELNGGSNCGDNKFREFTAGHRGEFFHWMHTFPFTGGTPLPTAMRRAGEFYKTSIPWDKYLNNEGTNTDANTYACRPSYHVLMTDGIWQTTINTTNGITRRDGGEFTLPEGGWSYPDGSHTRVYVDNASAYTVADVAMNYWANDLRPGLDNKVPAYIPFKNSNSAIEFWDPRNNPATWQHMSNFIMGLGLTSSLSNVNIPWAGSTHAGNGYANLKSGAVNWPAASSNSSNNVYDLWHAAINSRGEFYSVDDPDAMVQAFKDILSRIADRKSSAARPGTSNAMEADTPEGGDRLASYFYQTSYDSTVWSGDIEQIKRYREYNNNYNPSNPESKQYIEYSISQGKASENLPAHGARNIKIAGTGDTGLKNFEATTSSAGHKNVVGTLAYYLSFKAENGVLDSADVDTWKDRLNYIRGDRSKEGDGDNDFRARGNTVLGDFFASQPVVVSGARYLAGVADKLEGTTSYKTFVDTVKSRPQLLYVGGNAGMLHVFNTSNMKEVFAFIPTAVFPKLNKLTGKNYNNAHQYYVDGSPVVADVYDRDNARWRTILVGTLRAGGKGMFALDVTEPGVNGEGIKLLWELTDENFPNQINDNPVNVKLGYTFSKPTIARLHDGKWAVVIGNGYKADGANNGGAALLVIDAMTGNITKSLEVQSPINNLENGLSTPTLADFDGDGVADYAYAGDLHGNLWRFDLLGATASAPTGSIVENPSAADKYGSYGEKNDVERFEVGNQGKPLFTAKSVDNTIQSITAAPTLIRHPSRRGYIVTFGTGKYFEYGDKAGDESTYQTVYGVWDQNTKVEATSGAVITRTNMQGQEIASSGSGTGFTTGKDRETRTLGSEEVKWDGETFDKSVGVGTELGTKLGWYFDLKVTSAGAKDGEMVIEKIEAIGSTLFMQTLVPNDDPCTSGASNWLYAINAYTGGQTEHHAFDTRGPNGEIISAIKFGTEGGVSISQDETGFKANAPGDQEPIAPAPDSMGRQSWRMIQDI